MQIGKEKLEKKILSTARNEFLKYGFTDASLRKIAKKAKITTSNIYNYFRNKDEIFCKILSPTIDELQKSIEIEKDFKFWEAISEWNIDAFQDQVKFICNYIYSHKEELELIIFKSTGSSLENFRESFIDQYTGLFVKNLKIIKIKRPEIDNSLSYYTIRRIASFFVNVVSDIIKYDLSFKEMQKFLNEIVKFYYYGFFIALIKLKNE